MSFSVGDKVVHPKFGAGNIVGEQHRELVEGYEHYFVIQIRSTGATAYVPVAKMEDLGVRRVMNRPKLSKMIATLGGVPRLLSKDYKKRQARIREQLETGRPIPVAEAIRDLTWRRERKRLTQKDEQLLDRGIQFLATEMAVAKDIQIMDAREHIDAVLQEAIENGVQESDESAAASPLTEAAQAAA
jgi:CarD family transcriptional regulator